ncbi:MAG: site-specific integrase [Actinobacteria bacterium]|nr:site-specific integrase [Actinomycetota bacterium]
MAFIEKRGSSRWRARYRAPDGHERSQTFERKVDAERWLASQAGAMVKGEWVDPVLGRTSFAEWCKQWQSGLVGLRPTTYELNVGTARRYLVPRFGSWPLARINHSDVKTMVAEEVASARLSNSAIRRQVLVLSTILAAAVADGRIARNPCAGVKLPPENARPMRFLEPVEVVRVAEAAGSHYRPLILTAGFVGLRFGELAGLKIEKVNLLARSIRVDEQLVEVGGKLRSGPPKTRAGIRTVTVPAILADVLSKHFGETPVRASGLAFPSTKGTPLRRSTFRRLWRSACTRAGFDGGRLDGLVFHELRHSAVALAVREGAHPLAIKQRLGHASIQTTLDTYGGLFPSLDEAIAEGLDGALSEALAASSRPETPEIAHISRSEGYRL